MRFIAQEALATHTWDLIMCCHVLEHVSYPMDILSTLFSLMRSQTLLYIEVPYEHYWYQPWYTKLYRYLRNPLRLFRKPSIYIHEHINMFRENSLRNVLPTNDITLLHLQHKGNCIHLLARKN